MPASKTKAANSYSKPALRERLKKKIMTGSRGGRPGQWSARKSQLLVQEYEKAGGDYHGKKTRTAKNLESWTKEHWQTKTGKTRARHGKTTDRYLPKQAWRKLSPAEGTATDRKKRNASVKGEQFVANTATAKRVRKSSTKK